MSKKQLFTVLGSGVACLVFGFFIGYLAGTGAAEEGTLAGAGYVNPSRTLDGPSGDLSDPMAELYQMEQMLQDQSDEVRRISGTLREARMILSELQDLMSRRATTPTPEMIAFSTENGIRIPDPNRRYTTAEWDLCIGEFKFFIEKLNEENELAQNDLQQAYQDYQQAVQTLSSIQKQVYDDAMKIIDNLR